MTQNFDFNKALEQLQSGKGLTGADGVLTPLIKQLTEAALKAELDQHLDSDLMQEMRNCLQIALDAGGHELTTCCFILL